MTLLLNTTKRWRGRSTYTPVAVEKFTSYADSTALRTAVTLGSSLYSSDDIDGNLVTLDTAVTYNNHPTMRYDFVAGGSTPSQIVGTFTPLANAWTRTAFRFSPGFTVEGINNPTLTPDGRGVSGTVSINSSGTAATFSVSQQSATSVGSYGLLNNYIVLTSSTSEYAPSSPTRIYKVTSGSGTSWTVTKANASAADTEAATAFWIVSSFHGTGTCTISSSGTVATFNTAQIALTGSFISLYDSGLDTQPLNSNTDVYQVISGSGTTWTVVKQNASAANTRVASAFTIGSPVNPTGNGSANAYKFQFLAFSDQDGRSGIEFTGLTSYVAFLGATAGGTTAVVPETNSEYKGITDEFTSGAWYEIVQNYEKRSPTSARYRWWIRKQGVTRWTLQHESAWTETTNSPYVFPNATKLLLGRNYNQQRYPTQSHQMWWGEWEVADGSIYNDPWNVNNNPASSIVIDTPGSTVVIDTASAMMWENWTSYANTAAFYADARELSDPDPSFATGGANCKYNLISWGRNFELRTGSIYKGHPVLRANQPSGGQTPQLSGDTRVAGVATSKANIIMYWSMRYSNGWTDVNPSYGGAMAYKIFSLGLTSPTGRLGMAWTNTDQLVSENYWGGYGDNRDAIGPTEIAFNTPQIFGRPSSLWTNSPIIHTLVDVQTSPSSTITINYYIWADGDPKPSIPTHTHTDYSGGGTAPLINAFKLGNNMNAPILNTQYIEWLEWGIWDRNVNSNPVNTNIRNIPSGNYIFGDNFTINYANTIALRAQIYQSEPVRDGVGNSKPLLTTQIYNDCSNADNLIIAPSPVTNANGELTAKIQILNSSGEPNIIKSNLTPMNNAAYYFEQAYESGFTPVGANSGIGQGYKIAFMGYNNANGRVTLEWVGSLLTFGAGWVDSGAGNASYGSTNADFVPPYAVTGTGGIWTTPQYICVLMTSEQINAEYQKTMLWTWLKDGPLPAYPTRVHYDRRASGSLPVVNALVMGANYNQALGDRTAAPTGIYWRQHRMYNLSVIPDPIGVASGKTDITFSSSTLTVARGNSTTVTVTINRGGYTGTITPTLFGSYSGITLSNSPAMTPGISSTTLTISASGGAPTGNVTNGAGFSIAFSGIGGVYQIPLTVT